MKPALSAAAAALSLTALAPSAAEAALTATVQLSPRAAAVVVGQPLAVDVYLRNLVDTNAAAPARVGGVELDFGGVSDATSPRRFVAGPGAPAGFAPGASFAATLSLAFDGSLLDGHTAPDLSYFVPVGSPPSAGLATNGGTPAGDVLVGTLYVTASAPGVGYALNANGPGTGVYANDAGQTRFALTYVPATFTAVAAPEPATLAAVATLGIGTLTTRRRRQR